MGGQAFIGLEIVKSLLVTFIITFHFQIIQSYRLVALIHLDEMGENGTHKQNLSV